MLTRQQTAERSSRMRMFSRKYSSGDTLTMQCRQIRVLVQCTTRGWSACVIIRTFSKLSCVRRFEALVEFRVSRPRVVTCPVIIVLTFLGTPENKNSTSRYRMSQTPDLGSKSKCSTVNTTRTRTPPFFLFSVPSHFPLHDIIHVITRIDLSS